MSEREDLSALSRMVDAALQLAAQMKQDTAAYILSMASLEISNAMKATGRIGRDDRKG
ncbi:hypothetical protein [uncultured Bradyrhizobium sp.]|uniref:hypothetical protein n=1 Tax=uncultured Bradyrhizobium sp. TaxID=199684 RepID=UPI0035CBB67A